MNKLSKKTTYYIFALSLAVGVFTSIHSASADTYTRNCNSGGTVTSTVNITPGTAPYIFGPGQTFNATGSISTISCTINQVNLTARNNFGADENLIASTYIAPTATIPSFVPASQTFATPNTPGSYKVSFITGVNEPQQPVLMGSTAFQYATSIAACNGAAAVRAYYTQFSNYPISGQMIYDNYQLTMPSMSNFLWSSLVYLDSNGVAQPQKAGQTDPTGKLITLINC